MLFTHLHLHTEYSLLDGAILPKKLPDYLKELGMDTCAITDHGVMGGVIEFYKAMTEAKLKPILGIEAYITDDPDNKFDKTRDNMHMILLAKDVEGYSRLCEVVSKAAIENFYYKPRIYKENLRALQGHVVATTACLNGIFANRLQFNMNQFDKCISVTDSSAVLDRELSFYRSIFKDDFYLELQVWDDEDKKQTIYNKFLLEFGRKHGVPFTLAADCHYMRKEDHKLHEMLMALQLKMTLEEYRQMGTMQYGPHFYVAGPEEMLRRAKSINCEEAFNNTIMIANKCNTELKLGVYRVPQFKIEDTPDYQNYLVWKKNTLKEGNQ